MLDTPTIYDQVVCFGDLRGRSQHLTQRVEMRFQQNCVNSTGHGKTLSKLW
jgi:hypothetical protein